MEPQRSKQLAEVVCGRGSASFGRRCGRRGRRCAGALVLRGGPRRCCPRCGGPPGTVPLRVPAGRPMRCGAKAKRREGRLGDQARAELASTRVHGTSMVAEQCPTDSPPWRSRSWKLCPVQHAAGQRIGGGERGPPNPASQSQVMHGQATPRGHRPIHSYTVLAAEARGTADVLSSFSGFLPTTDTVRGLRLQLLKLPLRSLARQVPKEVPESGADLGIASPAGDVASHCWSFPWQCSRHGQSVLG